MIKNSYMNGDRAAEFWNKIKHAAAGYITLNHAGCLPETGQSNALCTIPSGNGADSDRALYCWHNNAWIPLGNRHSNQNLLINWYFLDPVNQRGQVQYTTAGKYAIDMWRLHQHGGQYDVGSHTMLFNDSEWSGIVTTVEWNANNPAQMMTASLLYSSEVDTAMTLFFEGIGASETLQIPAHELGVYSLCKTVPEGTTRIQFQLSHNIDSRPIGRAVIIAAKLELGALQTLAYKKNSSWILCDLPPDKALELTKCQRYQSVLTASGNNITIATGRCLSDGNITVALPIGSLRGKPSDILNPTGLVAATDIFSGNRYPITSVNFIGYKPETKMITALFKCPVGTVGTIYRIGLLIGNFLLFDANL